MKRNMARRYRLCSVFLIINNFKLTVLLFQCAQSVGLDIEDIKKCYNSEEGTNSQLTAEKETTSVLNGPLKSVPTIIFNRVIITLSNSSNSIQYLLDLIIELYLMINNFQEFNQELHQKSLEDFKSVGCALAQKSNPQACKEDSSSVVPL